MNRLAVMIALVAVAAGGACFRQTVIERRDWGAVTPAHPIRVQTHAGTTHTFPHFTFTTNALHGWPHATTGGDSTGERLAIPLDSIAAVRVRQLDLASTALVTAAAATAAFFIIAETRDDYRPPAQERPPASCPFIYTFDGHEYRFDSETYAGAVTRGLEKQDVDNLDHIRAVDGRYRLRLTNERPETHYTDELSLLVADHPRGTRAIPDAAGRVHLVGTAARPDTIRPFGGDTLPARAGWELSFQRPKADGTPVALVLRLRNTPIAPFALQHLLDLLGAGVHQFYRAVGTGGGTRSAVQQWMMREGGLAVSVAVGASKEWRTVTVLPDVGPAIAKALVVPIDLPAGIGPVRVRLESSPELWILEGAELTTWVGLASTTRLAIAAARDEAGADVQRKLVDRDGQYFIALPDSRVEVTFAAPKPVAGMERTVFAQTTGHYYIYSRDSSAGDPALVRRLMSDRAFSQRYFGEAWLRSMK